MSKALSASVPRHCPSPRPAPLLGAIGLAIALGLTLAGCTVTPAPDSGAKQGAAGSPDAAAAKPVTGAPEPEAEPVEAAAPAYSDPDKLVGQTAGEIARLLGEPAFIRRDPPAEFWRFRRENCVLELYFYPKDGAPTVDHYETRIGTGGASPDPTDGPTPGQCLGELIRDHDARRG